MKRFLVGLYLFIITVFVVNGLMMEDHLIPNMRLYAQGEALAPYQARALFVPVERAAYASRLIAKMAAHRSGPFHDPGAYPVYLFGLLSILGCGFLARSLYRKVGNGTLGWLVYPAILAAIVATWTMHDGQSNIFPYDLPSMFFFTLCVWLAWERKWWWLILIFPLATSNRETTLFLIPVTVLLMKNDRIGWTSARLWLMTLYMAVSWIAVTEWEKYRFPGIGSAAVYRPVIWPFAKDPVFWICMLAAIGFLWVFPVFEWRRIQNARLRSLVLIYPFWLAVMIFRGRLFESRIFGELIPLTAVMAIVIIEEYLKATQSSRAQSSYDAGPA